MTMPRLFLIACLLVAASGLGACSGEPPALQSDPDSLRQLGQGAVVGTSHPDGGHAWLGLPFAAPPVGELRWRAPREPASWTGTREALEPGAACVQYAGPLGSADGAREGEPTGSEDCLTLDVFAPRFEPGAVPAGDARLPVMVWIHGGGNTIGSAHLYGGAVLASSRDVVVVVVQYRLGVLGWFAHPSLAGEDASTEDRSGNYGTLDLVRALEWVRENVTAFGGDPGRVTIFGESAGGRNVFSLLLAPPAEGLFQRAIVQSGGTNTTPMAEAVNASDAPEPGHTHSSTEVLVGLLQQSGHASDRSHALRLVADMGAEEVAAYLRGTDAATLLRRFDGSRLGGMYRSPQLLRDGHVLPDEEPMVLFGRGEYHRVPVVLGTNRDENKLFLAFGSPHVWRSFGIPLYISDQRRYDLDSEYASLLWKARGVDEPAELMRGVQGASVFGYRFDWDDERRLLWLDLGRLLGAAHGMEIPFVFGKLRFFGGGFVFDSGRREADLALSRAMTSYWTEFARSGNPGRGRDGELPQWTAWSPGEGHKYLLLDGEDDGGIRMASEPVTRAQVVAQVATDPRFESAAERCAVYADFVRWSEALTREEYAQVGGGLCAGFPLDEDDD